MRQGLRHRGAQRGDGHVQPPGAAKQAGGVDAKPNAKFGGVDAARGQRAEQPID
jgi:hypothetical protein